MTSPQTAPRRRRAGAAETAYYVIFGALTLLASSVPYLIGWLHTPPGHVFTGLIYNIDDCAVYLSWTDQAARGHFFQHNQFTTEPQKHILFNLFFQVLGLLARVTGLPGIAIHHIARIAGGALLLWAVAALLRDTLSDFRARGIAYALVCVSAGVGWIWHSLWPGHGYQQPSDLWQPEAITFLSIYFAGLFTTALAAMVVCLRSALKVERTGKPLDAWPAAVAGALLGNFHSYDVIHVFAVWAAYRLAGDIAARRIDLRRWGGIVFAGIATLPTTAWQYYAIRAEPVFYQRAIVSATWSPAVWWPILGYGFVAALAVVAVAALPLTRFRFLDIPALRLLAVWAVVGLAVAYVPLAFQRKILMGEHLPLCLLAGAALAALTARLSGDFPKIAVVTVVALTIPSNIVWTERDLVRLSDNIGSTSHQPYLTTGEYDALQWLRAHARPEDAVLVSPDASAHLRFPGTALMPYLSVFVPAFAGCMVYNGHWSETAHYDSDPTSSDPRERMGKTGLALHFFRASTDDAYRIGLLRENGIRYVLYDNRLAAGPPRLPSGEPLEISAGRPFVPVAWPAHPETVPPYLRQVFSDADVTIYAFVPDAASTADGETPPPPLIK